MLLVAACAQPPSEIAGNTEILGFKGYACADNGVARFDRLRFDSTGKVVCRGEDCDVLPTAGRRIDAGGMTLWPGLIDAHAHLQVLGKARQQLDLTNTPDLATTLDRLAQWADSRPDDEWILGRGWNQMQWPSKTFPAAADLDKVVADRPVVLERVDGHAVWVNTAALEKAGINRQTRSPNGGEILRDENAEATGILIDNAETLVTRYIPKITIEGAADGYRIAIREANANGLTGVHEAGASFEQLQALKSVADGGDLTLRVYAMLSDSDDNLDRQGAPEIGLYDDRISIRSVKIYADGALGSRGAALLSAYQDRPETAGLLFLEEDALFARIQKANGLGYQAAIHAIGDRANRIALNAIARAQKGEKSPLRNRIEHAQVLSVQDIPRFSQLGVIASMQPVHATSDMWMAEERLDPDRLAGAYAWQRLRKTGAKLAFGSDFPVEPVNPFFGLHAAVTRQDRQGEPPGGWRAAEAMSLETALCGFTRDAAFAAGEETRVGSLLPGQWADFILLKQDPFAIDKSDLWQVQVQETWLAGQRVYDRNH
ncbi:MAG: amidohydrolase [Gammaproteobacteria bacterium]|nr:amidohydrolase [Gammaproteobacteria bacterium]